jgi:hypothetical protein
MCHMLYKNVSRNKFMSQNLSALQVFSDCCIRWKVHISLHCVCVTVIQAESGDALASFKMWTAWNASNSGAIDRPTMQIPRRLLWSGWDWLEGKCCYEEVDSVWKIFDRTTCKWQTQLKHTSVRDGRWSGLFPFGSPLIFTVYSLACKSPPPRFNHMLKWRWEATLCIWHEF